MFVENIYLRILFFVVFFGVSFWGLFLSFWRGSVAFGFNFPIKYIVLVTLLFFGLVFLWFLFGASGWMMMWVYTSLIVWLMYALWIIIPLFLLRDIVSIWYKIPGLIMIIVTGLYLLIGFYMWMTTKTTNLVLENTGLTSNYKFVFISDLHVQALRHESYVQKIVDKIQVLEPDFVLIGGDLLDRVKPEYIEAFLPFNQVDIPVYATLGNHEKIGKMPLDISLFEKTNIKFLRNQKVFFEDIQLVGIDDKSFWSGKNIADVLDESEIKDALYTILVSHQPYKLSLMENYPIDLQLAGHTHRGQFVPLSWIIGLFNDYAYGRYDENGKIAFVSQWVGAWWAPIRIGTQSELVLVELKR